MGDDNALYDNTVSAPTVDDVGSVSVMPLDQYNLIMNALYNDPSWNVTTDTEKRAVEEAFILHFVFNGTSDRFDYANGTISTKARTYSLDIVPQIFVARSGFYRRFAKRKAGLVCQWFCGITKTTTDDPTQNSGRYRRFGKLLMERYVQNTVDNALASIDFMAGAPGVPRHISMNAMSMKAHNIQMTVQPGFNVAPRAVKDADADARMVGNTVMNEVVSSTQHGSAYGIH